MSKSLLFFVAGFCLISVALGGDLSNASRSPLSRRKPDPVALTPRQACRSKGYAEVCAETSRRFCNTLRCRTERGAVINIGEAPDDMWCGPYQVCRNGVCVVQSTIPEPTTDRQTVTCKN